MPRPLRIEFAGAVYHVTTRGTRQQAIFLDDHDRAVMLSVIARTLKACDAQVFAYCLMGNHYHLAVQTRQANLSVLMRRINSLYSLMFNRRHGRSGHVFEGRYVALHVDRDAYLLEVCRYVDLNPVRARMVEAPGQWEWSSYRAHVGVVRRPPWLASAELIGALTGRDVDGDEASGRLAYIEWVAAGRGVQLWQDTLRRGLYIGGDEFIDRIERMAA